MEEITTNEIEPRPERPYDEQNVEALYRTLFYIASYIARDRSDWCEDLLQDTAIIMLQLLARSDHPLGDWEPYQQLGFLKRVLINRHMAMLREDNRLPLVQMTEEWYRYALETISDDESREPYHALMSLKKRAEDVIWEIAEQVLTPKQLDIFQLRSQGYSFREIAEVTNRTEVACRQSWNRGIRPKLRRALEEGDFT